MSDKDSKDYGYFKNRIPGRTYVSKRFDNATNLENSIPMRIIHRVEHEDTAELVYQRGELVLRISPTGKVQWKAVVLEDDRNQYRVTLQRFQAKSGKPHQKYHFSFTPDELSEFLKFVKAVKILPLRTAYRDVYDRNLVDALLSEDEAWYEMFENKQDLLEQFVKYRLTKTEIIALGYRKKQLQIFERLLTDESYFQKVREKLGKKRLASVELVWQKFFEQNQWIFGYGLDYIFTTGLDDKKLEQITSGFDILSAGKRVDALMKTRGAISSLCFVEIKTHDTPLLMNKPYRSESWAISQELTGAIAQVQKTMQKAVSHFTSLFTSRFGLKDNEGFSTSEIAYLYQPKCFVIIGDLKQFQKTPTNTNEEQYSSFEIFRRSITNPEIITFDELYERARYIVANAEEYSLTPTSDIFDIKQEIEFDPNDIDF